MTTSPLHYFAYGSNLHPGRMLRRVPAAIPLGCAVLTGHRLCFHVRSRHDRSGKCDAHYTGAPSDRLYGAVYALAATDKPGLDSIEGSAYMVVENRVHRAGAQLPVFLYRGREAAIDARAVPFDWYHALVIAGAHHHGLPDGYIATLEAVPVRPDPDASRAARAWAELTGPAGAAGTPPQR